MQNLNGETSRVCHLRNNTRSISQMDYNALIAVKDAVINNSFSWVSVMDAFKVALVNALGNFFSCRDLANQFHEIIYQITALQQK